MEKGSYNYFCTDCICGAVGKQKDFKIEVEKGVDEEDMNCPNNDSVKLKCIGQNLSGGTLKMSGKLISREDKQKIMLKRSHDHFKKEIEPVKREMNRKLNGD